MLCLCLLTVVSFSCILPPDWTGHIDFIQGRVVHGQPVWRELTLSSFWKCDASRGQNSETLMLRLWHSLPVTSFQEVCKRPLTSQENRVVSTSQVWDSGGHSVKTSLLESYLLGLIESDRWLGGVFEPLLHVWGLDIFQIFFFHLSVIIFCVAFWQL